MSQPDNVLTTILGAVAYSVIVIPVAFLIFFAVLYYFKPKHRLVIGIVAVTLGSIGLAIYSMVLIISLYQSSENAAYIASSLVVVEVLTICLGLISLVRRKTKIIH